MINLGAAAASRIEHGHKHTIAELLLLLILQHILVVLEQELLELSLLELVEFVFASRVPDADVLEDLVAEALLRLLLTKLPQLFFIDFTN